MQNLTDEEIDNLIEALEAWEAKDFGSELMFGVMGALFFKKDDVEGRAKFEEEEHKRKEEANRLAKIRKETSLILKAKLLQMKKDRAINLLEKA